MQIDRDKLLSIIHSHIDGDFTCLRVWSAWGYGTMTEDDFESLGETERAEELTEDILKLLSKE